ncbi:hypothetical protein GQ53DRAFT_658903 [Thozetella sp. PMI_491]|nr:hypothetical protein GQ53DRAFT_658903 [Thozetella sp. PMI_491]
MESRADAQRDRPRACAYCNKSKTRCTWDGEPGDGPSAANDPARCMRLNRSCTLPEKGARKVRGPSTRVGQLEEKIDGIMSLLNASQHIQQTQPTSLSQESPRVEPGQHDPGIGLPALDISSTAGFETVEPTPGATVSSQDSASFSSIDIVPGFSIPADEAERLLELYKQSYSSQAPFVPISPKTTAREMLERQPFLLRTILQAVAPQSAATQRAVDTWFRESIATSLVIDLALHRSPTPPGHVPNKFLEEAMRVKGIQPRGPHTANEMRAFLGVFYMASAVAVLFRRLHLFPYTSYIAHCCAQLEERREYDSDRLLVSLIRLQCFLGRIYTTFPNPEVDNSDPCDFNAPMHMALSSIRTELESLKTSAPADVQSNCLFEVIYWAVLIRLYEPVIYTRASGGGTDGTRRTAALWCGLEATRLFFNAWMAIPLGMVPYLPFPIQGMLSYGIITVSRLLSLSDADWNPGLVRDQFDVVGIVEQLSVFCGSADEVAASEQWTRKRKFFDEHRTSLEMHRDKFRWISTCYTTRLLPGGAFGSLNMMDLDSAILTPGSFDANSFLQAFLDDMMGAPSV